jgi:hypothetical protein
MIAMIVIYSISAITDLNEIRLLTALNDERLAASLTMEEIDFGDFWFTIFGYLQFLWYPALVLFLIWFYKVHRNLSALGGSGLEFRSRSVVFYFFVPILLLWKPYRATEEIWKVSDPSAVISDRVSRNQIGSVALVSAWWIFWIVSNMVSWYALRQSFETEDSIEAYMQMDWIYLVAEVLAAVSVALTVPMVREIDRRQAKKIQVMNSLSGNVESDSSPSDDNKSDRDRQDFGGLRP